MEFLIQSNLLNNDSLLKIKKGVEDLPHKFVGLIPFSREITSNDPIEGINYIPYGSTSFIEESYRRGFKGLSFDPHVFNYRQATKLRDDMLNDTLLITAEKFDTVLELFDQNADIFIRPSHDLKQFSGTIIKVSDARAFIKDALEFEGSGSYKLDSQMEIVVAQPKKIISETRWFIVNRTIISGSYYRINGELKSQHITDPSLIKIASNFRTKWLPDFNCVMDLAELPNGNFKVIEFNCINGSGFYDNDVKRVFTKLYEYFTQ